MQLNELLSSVVTPFSTVGYITYKRTYARRLVEDDKNSPTEEYADTVRRVVRAAQEQLQVGFTSEEEYRLSKYLLELKGTVAGRFLWQLGTSTVSKLGLASLQNCAFTLVNEPVRPFTWTMDMLMLGCGVGYNIQRHNVDKLPPVSECFEAPVRYDKNDADFIVPDSREGWVALLGKTLKSAFLSNKKSTFTYSTHCIRSKDTPIKGFGGTASGPESLCWGIEQISSVLKKRAGKKLRPVDVLDVMNIIGALVVAGNVRRSAQIAIGDPDDVEYLLAKRWDIGNIPSWRAMSNNSVVVSDVKDLHEYFWDGYEGKGEPYGLINLKLTKKVGRLGETQYPDPEVEGYNPCFTGDTVVAVADGRNGVTIKELAEQSNGVNTFQVYSAKEVKRANQFGSTDKFSNWKTEIKNAVAFKTGTKEVVTVVLSDGSEFRCTPEHLLATKDGRWVQAQESEGEHLAKFYTYSSKNSNKAYRHVNSKTNGYAKQYRLIWEFHNGKYDTSYQVDHVDDNSKNDNVKNLQLLSTEEHNKKSANSKKGSNNPVFRVKNKERYTWAMRRNSILLNGKKYGWSEDRVQSALTNFDLNNKEPQVNDEDVVLNEQVFVQEVVWSGDVEDVYDLTVEDNHNFYVVTKTDDENFLNCSGVLVHNCAEQGLAPYETCCLAETFLPNFQSKEEFLDCVKLLYRVNKHSLALQCHNEETQSVVNKNMRMGIGVTGVLQANEEQKSWLSDVYVQLRQYDVEYSKEKGFPSSIKLTTVKPSGTLSLLPGVPPGCHPAYSRYMIRRIRIASNHPLVNVCAEHGYDVEYQKNFDGTEDHSTVVVSFPFAYPEGTVLAKDVTAVQQLETVRWLQSVWSDNSVSCTVYYKKEELPEIKKYLQKYYKSNHKSLSFLLHSEHGFKQAPLEEITKEQYERLVEKTKLITSVQDASFFGDDECATGACPVK